MMASNDSGMGASMTRPSLEYGCLMLSLAAWRYRRLAPFSPLPSFPYFLSPTTGHPLSAMWTRIWCFLPVRIFSSTRLCVSLCLSTL